MSRFEKNKEEDMFRIRMEVELTLGFASNTRAEAFEKYEKFINFLKENEGIMLWSEKLSRCTIEKDPDHSVISKENDS